MIRKYIKTRHRSWVLAVAMLLLLLPSLPGQAAEIQGRVVGISDGDTLTLLVDGNL